MNQGKRCDDKATGIVSYFEVLAVVVVVVVVLDNCK